jgi:site-specific DNA recombinase
MGGRPGVVAGVRVSTEQQAEQGLSLDAQRAKLTAYATLYDLDLVAVEVDASASAKTLQRPALQRALGALKAGRAETLLVVKLDRLTRSVKDLGALVETYFLAGRWSLMSVNEQIDTRTAAGRMVLNILAAVSQWERAAIGERTAEAMAYKRRRREYTGGEPPYGWRRAADGVHLDPHADEQAIIAEAVALKAAGLSLRKVGAWLAARGRLPRQGKGWHPKTVRDLLQAAVA